MQRIYITGINGFVGQTIIRMLKARTFELKYELLETTPTEINILNKPALRSAIEKIKPDYIIHLAAQSFVSASFSNPKETFDVNFYGTLNLLEVLSDLNYRGRLLYVGSGDVYGFVEELELPVLETNPIKPRNPYAVSKAAAEALCYQWSQTHNFDIVMARPFNHLGPGQSERFVVSDFTKQIVEIMLSVRSAEIFVGDLDVSRDFTDVEDVIRGYFLLLDAGKNGEVYNICSGKEVKIYDILKLLQSIADVEVSVTVDNAKIRPAEQRRMYASYKKLNTLTGWKPRVPLEETLKNVLNYWTKEIKKKLKGTSRN